MTRQGQVATHILAVAGDLFYREGIRAVGVDRIVQEADIARATLYRHFRTKEDLVMAYLQSRHDAVMAGLAEVEAQDLSPRDKIALVFARLHQKASTPEFRGCAFGLAVAEHGASPRITTLARMHKDAVAEILIRIAGPLGRHIALLYDGALARRAVYGHAGPVAEARDFALSLMHERANV